MVGDRDGYVMNVLVDWSAFGQRLIGFRLITRTWAMARRLDLRVWVWAMSGVHLLPNGKSKLPCSAKCFFYFFFFFFFLCFGLTSLTLPAFLFLRVVPANAHYTIKFDFSLIFFNIF